ncbi:hypothetical protein ColTof4_04548 [Colletotrichum tofieldiae]|uniref:Uncharacterized protein n=1 Tax=Colletotrichum tofieldiae TaxID=708197 RepID=A0A166N3L7_9PEZI|nr:hypothetical protein CT0861_04392 [Colletotrichum tofieldiae]GKT63876.1 hypothetical protein ColTof3_11215 [Colletotrichum tofieldiae]GKT72125.1 hypothetical protein ColTof4_04548 [Colletotrichum tofieldiae]
MLPPKAKFVREIERGRHEKDSLPLKPSPSDDTLGTPSPPDATYLARVLRRCRRRGDDASILPVYEKHGPHRHAIYTERPGSRHSAPSYGPRYAAGYRRDLVAATARRRKRLTFLALMLAGTVLVFGAGVLGFVLMSTRKA